MAFIKTLKDFLTKTVVYPTTKTNAVYDDTVGRLDTYLHNTLGAEPIDNVEEETAELRDADTLGGRYTAEDLDAMPKSSAVEDYANVEPPMVDADSLGGRYTAEDIYAMANRIVELESENSKLNSNLTQINNSLVNFKVKDSTHNSTINPLTKTLQPNSSYIAYTFGGGGIHGTNIYTKIWLIRTRDVDAFIIPIKDDGSTTTTISIEGLSIKIKSNTNLRMGIDKIS